MLPVMKTFEIMSTYLNYMSCQIHLKCVCVFMSCFMFSAILLGCTLWHS